MKPYIIGIAGESGVGKSTIANIIKLYYGVNNVSTISTDDLHKWERKDQNWDNLTHLNPDSNNLELGDQHLEHLSKNKLIYRSIYNHDSGCFNPPLKILPKKIIINEGLHAFFTEKTEKLTNLKIFINTDDALKTHWKIIRDTEKRGYKYNIVLDIINKRKADANIINNRQINIADVIIDIIPKTPIKNIGDKHEEINIEIDFRFKNLDVDIHLFNFIKEYNESFKEFIHLSTELGKNLEICQEAGGNVSVKLNKYSIIKASGYKMKDISETNGYSIINNKEIANITNLDKYEQTLSNKEYYIGERPSMEAGFHTIINKKYIIHTHPIYLTTILCLKNSEQIIKEIYKNYEYNYVKYITPGYNLFKNIKRINIHTNIYFLENHGLIITGDKKEEILDIFYQITSLAKGYLKNNLNNFKEFDLSFIDKSSKHYFFPDAVIFAHDDNKKEIIAANNYINTYIKELGKGRYISNNNISKLLNLTSEKYRRNL